MADVACRAAGIMIFRKRELKHQLLGLIALPVFQQKNNGVYDVPKGMIDPGENPVDCARRECYEETGLRPKKLFAGPHKSGVMWLWLAECDASPRLKVNPTTGMMEHMGYEWLDIDTIIGNCLDYLRPSLVWAKGVLQDG